MTFTINTCLNKQDYIKVMYAGLYRKPFYIFAAIFGLSLFTVSTLNYFNLSQCSAAPPVNHHIYCFPFKTSLPKSVS